MKGKAQQGFTLIELMIVIAVIGLLASLALPAYQSYVIRSKVTEGVLAASEAKTAVAMYFAANGALPPGGDNDAAGFSSSYGSPFVDSVDWHTDQRIEIEFDESALGISGQLELGLDPEINGDQLTWRCAQDANVSDENLRYLPSTCRERI